MNEFRFDDIRPYRDSEVNDAVRLLLNDKTFRFLLEYLFPGQKPDEWIKKAENINSVRGFQEIIMYPFTKELLQKSSSGITFDGLEKLKKDKAYLYISNHRDIILDSAILNVLLYENNLDTCEIAIGNNLLLNEWITLFVKLNKNFIVRRDLSGRQLFEHSQTLSHYIRQQITQHDTSVWIAQREGRTKDGNDKTQQGVLKMLGISGENDFYQNYSSIRIAPMAISYEYDPCDILKAKQLYLKNKGFSIKRNKDDLRDILQGLTGIKGRIHLSLGKIVDEKLKEIATIKNKNKQLFLLADLIDQRIHKNYKLWPTNYIAYDRIYTPKYSEEYTKEDCEMFDEHLRKQSEKFNTAKDEIYRLILTCYAMPVLNKARLKDEEMLSL
ncbi:MAG: glycerol acyltransferase [Chitinophagaceae bacterium]|nr:MAG: glycerol acyltransferase [Chitinophagaceae bacterium]